MEEQPIPKDTDWPWNSVTSRHRALDSEGSVGLRVLEGVREYCSWCGEMIFRCEPGCQVQLQGAAGWQIIYLHPHCYVCWEQEGRRESDSCSGAHNGL